MNTEVNAQQAAEAWAQLQRLVEEEVKETSAPKPGEPRLQWSTGCLFLMGTWQVEARFDNRSGFLVRFDRFAAQLGQANFELPPGASAVPPETWKLQPVQGKTKVFLRYEAQDLPPELLAPRIVQQLKNHYEKYRTAAIR
jgi:hypothetical protein